MTTEALDKLTTNIADVPCIGHRHADAFRRLGIRCVADLVLHLPQRYEHELPEQTIAAASEQISPLHGADANITLRGEIASLRWIPARRPRMEATLQDDTGAVKLIWFNSPWLREKIHPGLTVLVWGRAKRHGDLVQMVNPRWEAYDPDQPIVPRPQRHRPIYPASEELPSRTIERAVEAVLDAALAQLDDHLHDEYRKARALPTLAEAYRMVHRPADADEPVSARRRLAFDELLLLQLAVMLKRRHRREAQRAVALKHNDAINAHITARFPFELTGSQSAVIHEIAADLQSTIPMNRLLQGDVGAGKTVVALYGLLMAVASGHQAALMAPTELLAEQHDASISQMLTGARVSIELLTGSQTLPQRREILARLESGQIDILIGTHALLTEIVQFKSLALAVIDEQHRFGVHQRARLRSKGNDPTTIPHTLVMTATPIPRTLSLTVFGDLDISTIRGLPPGRKPITTRITDQSKAEEVYQQVAERLNTAEQAFIVVPMIDESGRGLKDVNTHLEWLAGGFLRGRRLAAMHGRLDRDEREQIMSRFRAGEIDALVCTTVIEVGVDVPNASIMVIEHAERFGLAQLHQLRGRIGRASRHSLCVLLGDPTTKEAEARLKAIASTSDGFEIAEKDLEIRGPGELFGARQSGLAPFRVAQLPRDLDLLQMARRDAKDWIASNPTLGGQRDALLRRRLLKAHGQALGLGDVA
ncbi:MAG: ATP-dependent DNA helicase RecG [Planctomycetota bacterium]|nr:ATP-dependent DNA helicase RecG [Planctomycetota bacterium]